MPLLLAQLSALLVAAATAATPASAQNLYLLKGSSGYVGVTAGPNSGPCNYPSSSTGGSFDFEQDAVCPGFAPKAMTVGAVQRGDVAVDRQGGVTFVTDGFAIGAYGSGHLLGNFTATSLGLTPPLRGLGWDGVNRWLWICDGDSYAAVEPNGTCSPTPRVSAIPAPPGLATLSDIDRDGRTGDIWTCDEAGNVAYFPVGAPLASNVMHVSGPLPGCDATLDPLLFGLAVDPTTDWPVFNVTDGSHAARLLAAGPGLAVAAPPTFAQPEACWELVDGASPHVDGLAYAARSVYYGDSSGAGTLVFGTGGQSTLPSPNFHFEIFGGEVGQLYIAYDFAAACPTGSFAGMDLYLPMSSVSGVIGPLSYGGSITIPAPLAAAPDLPYGVAVFAQAFLKGSTGAWRASRGLSFTFSRP